MQVAQDKAPTKLLFKKLQTVSGWQEIVVIALGDQARNNRPDAVPQAAWLLSLEDLGIFKDDQVRCRSFHPGGGVCCNFVERPAHIQCEAGLVQRSNRWLFARVS